MLYDIYGYKNAKEIIEHNNYREILIDIISIIESCPVFKFKGKSSKNPDLEISQIFINKYLDYKFSVNGTWDYHPDIITELGLKADFRKRHNSKHFQIEVQFGNASRWYSDVFKFQIASIYNFTDIGISIVPKLSLANMIDSNVTNYERCIRELPHINHLLHIPILIIGVDIDTNNIIDLWDTNFTYVETNRPLLDLFDRLTQNQKVAISSVYKHLSLYERSRRIIYGVINELGIENIDDSTEMIDLPNR